VMGQPECYSGPVPFREVLCLTFSTFLAVSKGASQGQSINLILRSPEKSRIKGNRVNRPLLPKGAEEGFHFAQHVSLV
jgi:hypothetical protein